MEVNWLTSLTTLLSAALLAVKMNMKMRSHGNWPSTVMRSPRRWFFFCCEKLWHNNHADSDMKFDMQWLVTHTNRYLQLADGLIVSYQRLQLPTHSQVAVRVTRGSRSDNESSDLCLDNCNESGQLIKNRPAERKNYFTSIQNPCMIPSHRSHTQAANA